MKSIFLVFSSLLVAGECLFAQEEPRIQLDWRACVDLAINNNRDLKAAQYDILGSEEDVIAARSGLLPQAKVSGSVRRSDGYDEERYGVSLSAGQLIYDGGRTWNELEKSKMQSGISMIDYRIESANARYKLRVAYINLLKAGKTVEIWEKILQRRQESRRLVSLRYDAGREHKGSLLTAEAREAEAEVEVKQAVRYLDLARNELMNAIGIIEGIKNFTLKNENFVMLSDPDVTPDFKDIVVKTPSLERQAFLKTIAEINVEQSKGGRLPSVQLSADTGLSGTWPPEEDSWSAGIGVSIPLFEGWSRTASIRRNEAVAAATAERYEREIETMIQTMRQRWTDFVNSAEMVGIRDKYRIAATERAKIAEAQYSGGLLSFDNWIIIENDFVSAERTFINARAEAMSAEAAWQNILGRTLEDEKNN